MQAGGGSRLEREVGDMKQRRTLCGLTVRLCIVRDLLGERCECVICMDCG